MLPYRDKRDSVPRHICNLFPKCYIIRNLLVIQVLGAGFAFGKFGSRMWGEARKKSKQRRGISDPPLFVVNCKMYSLQWK